MIYEDLNDIADEFDVFLFDAYGVFWEGNGFYPNSRETMHGLIEKGKTVVVLSNTTLLYKDVTAEYTERGLLENRDYNYFVTSGDLLQNILKNGSLEFQSLKNPHFYYVIGKPHNKAFAGTIYERTFELEKADFVYCGVPFLVVDDVIKYAQYADYFLPARADPAGNIKYWDTLTIAPYTDIIERVIARKIPVLNANSDFVAKEGHPLLKKKRKADFVIRSGTFAQMFKEAGLEVLDLGKPYIGLYEYVFSFLKQKGIKVNKDRCCMIGDTIRTDIKGAINAGITPVLCVKTGITAEEIFLGKSVEKLCQAENIDVQQVIQIKSIGGK